MEHIEEYGEVELTITEDFYNTLLTLTIDPRVELEKLHYMTIVTASEEKHAIFWFKEVYKRGDAFYARAQQMTPSLSQHKLAVKMLNALAVNLKRKGIQTKR